MSYSEYISKRGFMKKIMIFSGAGLSAESGISTFRDDGGLWSNYDINRICTAGCLNWNYDETIHFYNLRRKDIEDKQPNKAHLKIAEIKSKYPDLIDVVTQNVDDLLERANCKDVLHLHGFLREIKCMSCGDIKDISYKKQENKLLLCDNCSSKMRPNVVFFNEAAPKYIDLNEKLEDCGLFIVIGTSGNVVDVNYLSKFVDYSILNNLYKSNAIVESYFDEVHYSKATEAIDSICDSIENYIKKNS